MLTKSQIPWLLAALVLTAHTRCVFSHAIEAADRHQRLQSDEQPLDSSRRATCENESSCICKGATLAAGVKVSAPELSLEHAVCVSPAASLLGCMANSSDRRFLPDDGEFPSSGESLRAQLQRFLL